MEQTKKVSPKREKMLRVIAKAAQARTLIGGDFYTENIESTVPEIYDETLGYSVPNPKLMPEGGCKSAGRCAMAELFFAAGYSNKKLADMDGRESGWDQKDFRTLWDNYRIDALDASKIIGANDDVNGCSLTAFTKRQNKVARVITNLKDRNRVDPYRYELSAGEKHQVILTKEENALLKELVSLGQYRDLNDSAF